MINNIPIYRAKKIDNDEYVKGFYWSEREIHYIAFEDEFGWMIKFEIDSTTLSIHFSLTKDSDDTPIFASLQEDGKGGDVLEDLKKDRGVCTFERTGNRFFLGLKEYNFSGGLGNHTGSWTLDYITKNGKVIGIQE